MGTQGNTPYFTRKCRAKIRRTPDKSFRKNAKEMDVHKRTIRMTDKAYGLCQVLKPVSLYSLTAIRQADLNRKIMWILKKKIVILFTDEKYFAVD